MISNNFECTAKVSNADFERPKPGMHSAKCINVIDGRWVKNVYKGQDKGWVRKIIILWALEQKATKGDYIGQCMLISKEYTFSIADKSNLRKDLESWRGKPFEVRQNQDGTTSLMTKIKTKEGKILERAFKVDDLIGANCNLFIEHKQSQAGNTYSLVSFLSPLDKEKYVPVDGTEVSGLISSCIPDWLASKIADRPVENPALKEVTQNNTSVDISSFDENDVPF